MSLISFCAVWSFSDLFSKGTLNLSAGLKSGVMFAAHLFRQTRMRLLSIMLVLAMLVITKGKIKNRIVAVVVVVLGTVAIFTTLKSNLLFELFESSYYDITQKEGTWGRRIEYIGWNFKELMKSPIVGTGSSAVRANEKAYEKLPTARKEYFLLLGKQTDLGYVVFIRNFGLVGLIWLVGFFFTAFRRSWILMRLCKGKNEDLASFCFFYMVFLFVASVTLNYFTLSDRIFLNCFVLALIIRLQQECRKKRKLKQ
jgi:cell division protein FtsW (lipid II flippase)